MARKTTTLLPLTGATELDTIGAAVPGDSYYGYTDGVHTVAVYGNNFSGRIKIQGTLATTPTEDDWFDILLTGIPSGNPLKLPIKSLFSDLVNGFITSIFINL